MLPTPILKQERSIQPNVFDNDQVNDIIAILQTAPHKRSSEQLQDLKTQLTKLAFFADLWPRLTPETTATLLKQLRHEYSPRARTIFNYGDPPTSFYLVLNGSVFVIAPKQSKKMGSFNCIKTRENIDENSPKKLRRFSVIRLDSDSHKHLENLREEDSIVTPEELSNLHPGNFVLDIKRQGDKFGEAALNFGSTRTATIVSREHTHLITLHPSIYLQILSQYQETMQKDCVEFFRSAPLTSDWPSENLIALSYLSKTSQYLKNQPIYEIGDQCDYVYFIINGEVEIVKETHLDMTDDEAAHKTVHSKHHLNLEKSKLSHVNAIWKQQYSKLKVQNVTVALLGKCQAFGNDEFAEGIETRQTRAIVKSLTADILVVSYKQFVENKNNPRDLCQKLLNIHNTPKTEWRQDFARQMIEMRLQTENNNEKAKSKFGQEFADSISILAKPNETEPAPEREIYNKPVPSNRRLSLFNDLNTPSNKAAPSQRRPSIFTDLNTPSNKAVPSQRRLTIVNELDTSPNKAVPSQRKLTLVNDLNSSCEKKKSIETLIDEPVSPASSLNALKKKQITSEPDEVMSPSSGKKPLNQTGKLVEEPVVTPSVLPLKGAKKKKFITMIHPDAKEVKVVFNERNKIAIDPSLVSVCLDLSPHSFQGSKVYQKRRLATLGDSSPRGSGLSSSRNFTILPTRMDSIDMSDEKSPIVRNLTDFTSTISPVKASPSKKSYEKKLGEILGMKNPKLQKQTPEHFYHSMCINSVFMNDTQSPKQFEDIAEIRKKGFLSPKQSNTTREKIQLPSISTYYSPGLALPRTLPQKKPLGSYRNQ